MTVIIAFFAGVVVGWLLYKIAVTYGTRLMADDDEARLKILDNLSFSALVRLRDAASNEIEKRRGTT